MAFKYRILAFNLLLSSLVLSACTVKEEKIIEKQAPVDMRESFSPQVKSLDDECAKKNCITIQKSSLGKVFLLIASGKTAGSTPQWYDLKPQVVSFEKSGSKVALLAENYNSIYEEIKTSNLVQTFDVISEDEKAITFDWGAGLKTFVVQNSFDVDGARENNNNLTESSFQSIPVLDSFVRSIKFDEKNIELEQISKVRGDKVKPSPDGKDVSIESREETLAMNIQIRSYNLSSEFKKKEYDVSRRVGFFVTKVAKRNYSQDVVNLITKWDLSPQKGPIVVRISAAVPQEYVQAVREGALYWNKVFGRDVIEVKTGVDPQAGPEDRSIFVRWIPWLDSGAAYAMGQSDPLSGEILRAQVFMPSVFTRVGSTELVSLNGDTPVAPGALACDLTQRLHAVHALSKEVGSSQRLRLAQDAVRSTVAHELGHALGLRHNFAGSYSAKVSTNEIYEVKQDYLKDLSHKGLETSTSIMDYVGGIDEILMSARLKFAPLSYDKMAMDWAYSDSNDILDEKISLYCTDDDIALAKSQELQIYGCERFDSGNNPLYRNILEVKDQKNSFVKVLFASILSRLYPVDKPDYVEDLDKVLKDTIVWGRLNLEPLEVVVKSVMDVSKNGVLSPSYASIKNTKSGQFMLSKMGYDEDFKEARLNHVTLAGGYAALLNALLRNSDGSISLNWLEPQIAELKSSSYFSKGATLGGRNYELNSLQQEKIIKFFEGLISVNRGLLATGLVELLPKVEEKVPDDRGRVQVVSALVPKGLMTEADAEILANLYLDLIGATEGSQIVKVGAGLIREVSLPKSLLSRELKLKWVRVLSSAGLRFDMSLKAASVRNIQEDKINAFLQEAGLLLDVRTVVNPADLVKELKQQALIDEAASEWLTEELSLLVALRSI